MSASENWSRKGSFESDHEGARVHPKSYLLPPPNETDEEAPKGSD